MLKVEKEMITMRMPKELVDDLEYIRKFNNTTRTDEIIRCVKNGVEKQKKTIKTKYYVFAYMILLATSTLFAV